jgi:16S rRNA (guanine527-N7)-methyltransferase
MIGSEDRAKTMLIEEYNVSRETLDRLSVFRSFLAEESERQNLVAKSSLDHFWNRHILDSVQLLRFAPQRARTWLDLGTGAGFPGLIVGLLFQGRAVLIEERRKRIEFLEASMEILGLQQRVTIKGMRVEKLKDGPFDVISARAFAPLGRLFELSHSFSTEKTRWILPKGRNAAAELEAVRGSWHGAFSLEPSLTDDDAHIIVAEGVRRTERGGKTA